MYSPTQLCLWVRNPRSGLIASIGAQRPLAFLYRNSPSRTTLTIRGRGKIVDDPKIRRQIFDLSPEVEQRHDPAMAGAAVIVDVARIQGTSPKGPVSVVINWRRLAFRASKADLASVRSPPAQCVPKLILDEGRTLMGTSAVSTSPPT